MSAFVTKMHKEFRFEAAHRLPHVPEGHKCRRLHGHSFRVEIHLKGPIDPHLGWICDFADITALWQPLHAILDHHYLNEVPGLENPTSENIAAYILSKLLPSSLPIYSVTVKETCTSSTTVYAPSAG